MFSGLKLVQNPIFCIIYVKKYSAYPWYHSMQTIARYDLNIPYLVKL